MESLSLIMSIIGVLSSLSSIVLAYLAFTNNNKKDTRASGKNEGIILSDIGYIKACVDRVEKNVLYVDERYRLLVERLARIEEISTNNTKRLDKHLSQERS